jgi:hypothetical protein
MRSAPSNANELRERLASALPPPITHVVILIDEVHLGLEPSRDLAKSLDGFKSPRGLEYHVVLSCLAERAGEISTTEAGPRSPRCYVLQDFDLPEVQELLRKLENHTTRPMSSAEFDEASGRVLAETGGIPDVTVGFLHEIWEQWTSASNQSRPIGTDDVARTADSPNGIHIDRLNRILGKIRQPHPDEEKWRTAFSRILARVPTNDRFDDGFTLSSLRAAFLEIAGKECSVGTDGLIKELLDNHALRSVDGRLRFRGRLLRRRLNLTAAARG